MNRQNRKKAKTPPKQTILKDSRVARTAPLGTLVPNWCI